MAPYTYKPPFGKKKLFLICMASNFCGCLPLASALQLPVERQLNDRLAGLTAWVVAFGRSGSSTLQSFIAESAMATHGSKHFELFEPCHPGDQSDFEDCKDFMEAIIDCNFTNITKLRWWGRSHAGSSKETIVSDPKGKYSSLRAHELCAAARFRTHKTINVHDLKNQVVPLLNSFPTLFVVNLVRDPRGIFQSTKESARKYGNDMVSDELNYDGYRLDLSGFQDLGINFELAVAESTSIPLNVQYINYLCETMKSMHSVHHPRLLHVRMEDVLSGKATSQKIANFIGLPWNGIVKAKATGMFSLTNESSSLPFDIINHYPGVSRGSWSAPELDAIQSKKCTDALSAWGYPTDDQRQ